MVKESEKAPDFTLLSDNKKDISLSNYQAKKVVMYFYPRDGSDGFKREAIEFRDLIQVFEKEGITILGTSKESVKSR